MPSTYSPSQKASIAQFVGFTQAKDSAAAKHLKAHGWNVEQAVDAITTSPESVRGTMDTEMVQGPGEDKEALKEAHRRRGDEDHKSKIEKAWWDMERMLGRIPLDRDGTTIRSDDDEHVAEMLLQSQEYPFDYDLSNYMDNDERPLWTHKHRWRVAWEKKVALKKLLVRLYKQSQAIRPTHFHTELRTMYRFALKRPLMPDADLLKAFDKIKPEVRETGASYIEKQQAGRARYTMLGIDPDIMETSHVSLPFRGLLEDLVDSLESTVGRARDSSDSFEDAEEATQDAKKTLRDAVGSIWGSFRAGEDDFPSTLDRFRSVLRYENASDQDLTRCLRELDIPLANYLNEDKQLRVPKGFEICEQDQKALRVLAQLTVKYLTNKISLDKALTLICDHLDGLVVNRELFAEYLTEAPKAGVYPYVIAQHIWDFTIEESEIGDAGIEERLKEFKVQYQDQILGGLDPGLALTEFRDQLGLDDFSPDQVLYFLTRVCPGQPVLDNETTEERREPVGFAMNPPSNSTTRSPNQRNNQKQPSERTGRDRERSGTPMPRGNPLQGASNSSANRSKPKWSASVAGSPGRPLDQDYEDLSTSPEEGETDDLFGLLLPLKKARRIANDYGLPSDFVGSRVRSSTSRRTIDRKRRKSSVSITSRKENPRIYSPRRKYRGTEKQKRKHTPFAEEGEDQESFVRNNFPEGFVLDEIGGWKGRGTKRQKREHTPFVEEKGENLVNVVRNDFSDMSLVSPAGERLSIPSEAELSGSLPVKARSHVESSIQHPSSPVLPSTEFDSIGQEVNNGRVGGNVIWSNTSLGEVDRIWETYRIQFESQSFKPRTLQDLLMVRLFDHEVLEASSFKSEAGIGYAADELLREISDYARVGAVDPPSSNKHREVICMLGRITIDPTPSNVHKLQVSVTRDELEDPPVTLDLNFFEAESSVHVLLSYCEDLPYESALPSRQSPDPAPWATEPSSDLSTPMSTRLPSPRPDLEKPKSELSTLALSSYLQRDASDISVDPNPSEPHLTDAKVLGDPDTTDNFSRQRSTTNSLKPTAEKTSNPGISVRRRRCRRRTPNTPKGLFQGAPRDIVDMAYRERSSIFVQIEKQRRRRKKANVSADGDSYFQNSSPSTGSSGSTSALNKLFDKYRDKSDPDPDTVGVEGSMRYLEDLGVKLDEPVLLAVLTDIKAPTMGEMTRQGFIEGWKTHNASDLPSQKNIIRTYRRELPHPQSDLFRRTYKHTFRLALPAGQKTLPLDNATEYWRLLLSPPAVTWYTAPTAGTKAESKWLEWWLEYLETKWKKGVSRDMWEQMGKFVGKTMESGGESMGWWSEDGAWPGVVDGFVEFVRGKRGELGEKMEE